MSFDLPVLAKLNFSAASLNFIGLGIAQPESITTDKINAPFILTPRPAKKYEPSNTELINYPESRLPASQNHQNAHSTSHLKIFRLFITKTESPI
jgi:hypothetical protein